MRAVWLLGAVAAALLATGCERELPGPESTQVVLRRGNAGEPDTLDPQRSEDENSNAILRDLFEGLVGEGPEGALVPGGASHWTVSEDGLTWTFTLREDGRWSNGDPVTAEDYAAGLRRAVDPGTASSHAALLASVAGAEAIIRGEAPPESLGVEVHGERELIVRLAEPAPYLLGLMTSTFAFPVHRRSLAEHGAEFARPGRLISNGPYRLAEWALHDHVRLERNTHFREPPVIDAVLYYPIEDAAAELARYRAGELDFTAQIPQSRFRWLKENLGEELYVAPYLSTQFWMFNLRHPPLDDVRVREALTLAVDRVRLTEDVTGLGEVAAYGLVPPGIPGYTAQSFTWREQPREEQLEQARRLMAQAGFGPDRPLRLEVRYNTDENLRRIATAVAAMWREALGVETTLVNEELRVMLSRRADPTAWQVMRLAWAGDYSDASNFLEILAPGGALDATGFADAEYAALLEAARAEIDPVKRKGLLEAAERIVLGHYPMLPLYYTVSKHLVKPWVRGYTPSVLNRTYTRHLSVDTEERGF